MILQNGAVISGGTLTADQFAYFFIAGASLSGTAASPLTNSATIYVENADQLGVAGAIVNDGIISLNSDPSSSDLLATANVTLTGSGSIELATLSDNDRIIGAATTVVFDNETNTIEGGGEIGGGLLTLINRGKIDANSLADALQIDATSVTNTGLMESTNTAGLLIEDSVKNSGGVIAANNGVVNLSGATISGGVLSSTGSGVIVDQAAASLNGDGQPA